MASKERHAAADAFHAHLDVCSHCEQYPFTLCHTGDALFRAFGDTLGPPKRKANTMEELIKEISLRHTATDLDGHVHEFKSREASDINNAGIEEQISYLVEAGGEEWVRQVFLEDIACSSCGGALDAPDDGLCRECKLSHEYEQTKEAQRDAEAKRSINLHIKLGGEA